MKFLPSALGWCGWQFQTKGLVPRRWWGWGGDNKILTGTGLALYWGRGLGWTFSRLFSRAWDLPAGYCPLTRIPVMWVRHMAFIQLAAPWPLPRLWVSDSCSSVLQASSRGSPGQLFLTPGPSKQSSICSPNKSGVKWPGGSPSILPPRAALPFSSVSLASVLCLVNSMFTKFFQWSHGSFLNIKPEVKKLASSLPPFPLWIEEVLPDSKTFPQSLHFPYLFSFSVHDLGKGSRILKLVVQVSFAILFESMELPRAWDYC